MEQISKPKSPLKFLYASIYFMSYFTRYAYSAVMAELIVSMGVSKSEAGMALTGFFIVYGVSQIFSGIRGDQIQPKYVIAIGLVGTSLVNLSMAWMSNIYVMGIVWMLNGFFQSLFWPPLVRMVSYSYKGGAYNKTITLISQACNFGTICIFLATAGIVSISTWQTVFLVTGCTGLVCSLGWLFATRKIVIPKPEKGAAPTQDGATGKLGIKTFIAIGMIPVFVAVVINGCLRDGMTSWLSTYLNETFDFGTSLSILSSSILPIFAIICLTFVSMIVRKSKNELFCAAIFYLIAGVFSFVLTFFFKKAIALDIMMFALITGIMHGTNLILIGDLPRYFGKYGRISTISGVLNAFVYIGSAAFTYGIAVLADYFGWNITFLVMSVLVVVATACCFISSRKWKQISAGEETEEEQTVQPPDTEDG